MKGLYCKAAGGDAAAEPKFVIQETVSVFLFTGWLDSGFNYTQYHLNNKKKE